MKKFLFLSFFSVLLWSCSNSDNSNSGANSTVLKIQTNSIQDITFTGAKCYGVVTLGQGALLETGVCWSTSPKPKISDTHSIGTLDTTSGAYISSLSSLSANTTYYVRTYATDNSGTIYSAQTTFSTLNMLSSLGSGVTDIDGKVYSSIIINGKEWMQKNLDVSKYKNGDVIPQVTDVTQWDNLTTGAWCYYENDSTNGPVYGKLYNWYAVNDPRGLAPSGWHIPTDTEWSNLVTYLGGDLVAGKKLKDDSTTSTWDTTTNTATNQSGFAALPAGTAYLNYHTIPNPTLANLFTDKTKVEYWWSATMDADMAYSLNISCYNDQATRSELLKKSAISVRCAKN